MRWTALTPWRYESQRLRRTDRPAESAGPIGAGPPEGMTSLGDDVADYYLLGGLDELWL